MPVWSYLLPALGIALLSASFVLPLGTALAAACATALIGGVIAAVHHAEVVAHRVGEPFGTLVLAGGHHGDRGRADRLADAGRRA